MTFGSWLQELLAAPRPAADAEDGSASRMDYVDALLALMVKKSQLTLRLTASEPLPAIGASPAPSFQAVVNRLKVLSRLNPVVYAKPVQGKIEVTHRAHVLVYTTVFDDKADAPACVITLRIRNG
jgi:hypothetical protein